MTAIKRYKVFKTYADGSEMLIGWARQYAQGWKFFPATCAHQPSRKFHSSFDTVIPRWAGGLAGTRSELDQ